MFKKSDNNDMQEESKFMQLWHNKRTHAAMVLGLWMIFLAFVMLIAFLGGEANPNTNLNTPTNQEQEAEKEFKDYALMQEEILKNNFKYEYNIKIGEYQVIYKGEKLGATETGYRENASETIKYYIDETGFYKVVMDELDALDKLFENLNESYIDLEYIFELIKDKTVVTETLEETRSYTYNFDLEEVSYEIKVETDLTNITNITISFEEKEYNLKYMNIGELDSLSYVPVS